MAGVSARLEDANQEGRQANFDRNSAIPGWTTGSRERDGRQSSAWREDWSHEVSLLASFTCCWTHRFRAVGTAMQASNATIKNRGGLFQSRALSVMPQPPGLSRAGWFKPKLGWLTFGGRRRRQRFVSTDAFGASICQTAVIAQTCPRNHTAQCLES